MKKLNIFFLSICLLIGHFAFGQTSPVTPAFRANTTQHPHYDPLIYNYPGKIGGPDSIYTKRYIDSVFSNIGEIFIPTNGNQLIGSNSIGQGGQFTQETDFDLNGQLITYTDILNALSFGQGHFYYRASGNINAGGIHIDTLSSYLYGAGSLNSGQVIADTTGSALEASKSGPGTPPHYDLKLDIVNQIARFTDAVNYRGIDYNADYIPGIHTLLDKHMGDSLYMSQTGSVTLTGNTTIDPSGGLGAPGLRFNHGSYIDFYDNTNTTFTRFAQQNGEMWLINSGSPPNIPVIKDGQLYNRDSGGIEKPYALQSAVDSVYTNERDVFLIIGQSNAAGVAVTDSSERSISGNIYYYGGNVYPANDPFLGTGENNYQGSMWPSFGNRYTTLNSRKICFVQASKGGSAMIPGNDVLGRGYWANATGGAGSLYPQAATALQHCLDSLGILGYKPVLKGILISQGEADALYIGNGTVTANAYRDTLISVHKRFQKQFYAYNQNLPMFVFRTGIHNPLPDYLNYVRAPQEDAARHDSLLFVVARNAITFGYRHLMNPDTTLNHLHYSPAGYREMGRTGAEDVVLNSKTINPVVRQYLNTGFGGITEPTAFLSTQKSNDTTASINIPIGVIPATRVYEGDIYNSSSHHLNVYLNGTWRQLDNAPIAAIANGGTNNTTYTTNSIPYFDGTKLAEDNLNFYYKASNRQLNVGTTLTPGSLTLTGKLTTTNTIISSTGDISRNAWGTAGPSFLIGQRNVTDTTTTNGSTVTNTVMNAFNTPTLQATLATTGITYTNVANVYIQAAPVAGTNVTITNPYALWVGGGNVRFGQYAAGLAHFNSTGVFSSSTLATGDIANNAVTYGKMQAMTTNKLLGSGSGTAVSEITLGTGFSFSTSTLNYTAPNRSHTIFAPTTGGTVTTVNNQDNIINPAGTLATLTIALPSSPANNDKVYLTFTQAITAITYSNGTVVGVPLSATLGSQWFLTYDSASTTWY
jgi:hypothetical protein